MRLWTNGPRGGHFGERVAAGLRAAAEDGCILGYYFTAIPGPLFMSVSAWVIWPALERYAGRLQATQSRLSRASLAPFGMHQTMGHEAMGVAEAVGRDIRLVRASNTPMLAQSLPKLDGVELARFCMSMKKQGKGAAEPQPVVPRPQVPRGGLSQGRFPPTRVEDSRAHVGTTEVRILRRENIRIDGAIGRIRLVLVAVVESLNELLLE